MSDAWTEVDCRPLLLMFIFPLIISCLSSYLLMSLNMLVTRSRNSISMEEGRGVCAKSAPEPTTRCRGHVANSKVVEFDGADDPQNPRNWPLGRKTVSTILYGLTTMGATWSSAIYSTAVGEVAREFNTTEDVASLGTSLLLVGFSLGPLLWAPLSEHFGRRMVVLIPYFLGLCFTFGTAAATNFPTIAITRFLVGFFSSSPICITGGALGDMFQPEQRGNALLGYAGAVVGGPVFGENPLIMDLLG